jgi:PHP family Zn ribbon phosphoesterase
VEIGRAQGEERDLDGIKPKQAFIRMVPLIDILSNARNVKTKTAKSLLNDYRKIVSIIGPESVLWKIPLAEMETKLSGKIDETILNALRLVKKGNFTFYPYGYDGEYGTLKLGERGNFRDINVVKSSTPLQQVLF